MPKKRKAKFSVLRFPKLLILGLFILIGLASWGAMRNLGEQVSINEVVTSDSALERSSGGMTYEDYQRMLPAPSGCYYKQLECYRAPCEPIMICQSPYPQKTNIPSPTPTSTSYPLPSVRPSPVPPSPVASTSPICRALINSLNLSGRCGVSGFTEYIYQCSGRELVNAKSDVCLDYKTIYSKVSLECGSICNVSTNSSPVPNPNYQ